MSAGGGDAAAKRESDVKSVRSRASSAAASRMVPRSRDATGAYSSRPSVRPSRPAVRIRALRADARARGGTERPSAGQAAALGGMSWADDRAAVHVVLLRDGPAGGQPPRDHACVTSTRSEAAAAARTGAGLALRKRAELL